MHNLWYYKNLNYPNFLGLLKIRLTCGNSNLQGKSKKVQVIGIVSYRGENYKENDLKGKVIYFELMGGSSY